jgi:hypothetical protein
MVKRHYRGGTSLWRAGSVALVIAVTVGLLLANVPAALAAEKAAPAAQEGDHTRWLEHLYQRELWALEGQAMNLDFARETAVLAQEWIDDLAGQGKDVTDLVNALAAFNAGIEEAQGYHDTASPILSEHAGFDDNGKVVDQEQATETVRNAGRALRDAHRALLDASIDFRRAVVDWRRVHLGQ